MGVPWIRSACLRKARRPMRGSSSRTGQGASATIRANTAGSPSWANIPRTSGPSRRLPRRRPSVPSRSHSAWVSARAAIGQQPLLLGVEVLGESDVEGVVLLGEAVAQRGVGGTAPLGEQLADPRERAVDAGVLGLHQVDDRRQLLGHPLQQHRPQQLVLERVVVVEEAVEEVEVVGHLVGPPGVAGGHPSQDAGRQPELPAQEEVDQHHLAGVDDPGVVTVRGGGAHGLLLDLEARGPGR